MLVSVVILFSSFKRPLTEQDPLINRYFFVRVSVLIFAIRESVLIIQPSSLSRQHQVASLSSRSHQISPELANVVCFYLPMCICLLEAKACLECSSIVIDSATENTCFKTDTYMTGSHCCCVLQGSIHFCLAYEPILVKTKQCH